MSRIPIEDLKADLKELRLKNMAEALDEAVEAAQAKQAGHLDFLASLVEIQKTAMQKRSLDRRIKQANFPRNMSFDNFDWHFQPSLNVEQLKNLKSLGFIEKRHPLLIMGKTGCGKTHISVALGIEACKAGFRVKFFKFQELLLYLYTTLADDTTHEVIARMARLDLIIIDHVGFIRSKDEYPSLLLDFVCACQDQTALIVTTGISLAQWSTILGNNAIAADIMDRLFHHASVINIRQGLSYRTEGPQGLNIYDKTET